MRPGTASLPRSRSLAPFIFERAFTAKLLRMYFLSRTAPSTMPRTPRRLFQSVLAPSVLVRLAAFLLLVPALGLAQEKPLELDIVGGHYGQLVLGEFGVKRRADDLGDRAGRGHINNSAWMISLSSVFLIRISVSSRGVF